ncbi:Glutathione S-transferase [Quillaja saponaria]|uniref:glutathione transferase n=1 Tax=Quillaja saponaria TaxID=32244 RepID=A0AAD7P939_QUISA|nr:Glutathione S-transferase [Quillaja saponaria]
MGSHGPWRDTKRCRFTFLNCWDFMLLFLSLRRRPPSPLFESRAICRYVCEKYADKGNGGLYGTNPLVKASIDRWLEAEGQSFNPPTSTQVFQLAFAPRMKIKQDQGVIKQSEGKLAKPERRWRSASERQEAKHKVPTI